MKDMGRMTGRMCPVYNAVGEAVRYARRTPGFTRSQTYRYKGHGVSDRSYMERTEELREWMENKDPIHILRRTIVGAYPEAEAELNRLSDRAFGVVDDAVNFALTSEPPAPEDLTTHVYVE
jgi:pyruvate dehydrogenase E1 component alpha subunit